MTAGVGAHNVTPDSVFVKLNLRFSPEISFEEIKSRIINMLEEKKLDYVIDFDLNAQPYSSTIGKFTEAVQEGILSVTDKPTQLSCSGGRRMEDLWPRLDVRLWNWAQNLRQSTKSTRRLKRKNWNF